MCKKITVIMRITAKVVYLENNIEEVSEQERID